MEKYDGAGMDALGRVDVTVKYENRIFHGMGMSTDIIEAGALALLNAYNIIARAQKINEERKRHH